MDRTITFPFFVLSLLQFPFFAKTFQICFYFCNSKVVWVIVLKFFFLSFWPMNKLDTGSFNLKRDGHNGNFNQISHEIILHTHEVDRRRNNDRSEEMTATVNIALLYGPPLPPPKCIGMHFGQIYRFVCQHAAIKPGLPAKRRHRRTDVSICLLRTPFHPLPLYFIYIFAFKYLNDWYINCNHFTSSNNNVKVNLYSKFEDFLFQP